MGICIAFIAGWIGCFACFVIDSLYADRKWRAESHRRWAEKHGGTK